jgi:hypothetical protein
MRSAREERVLLPFDITSPGDSGIGKILCLKSRPSEQWIDCMESLKMGEAADSANSQIPKEKTT